MICGFALSLARYVLVSRTRILDGCVRNSRRQSLDYVEEKMNTVEKLEMCEHRLRSPYRDGIYGGP